MNSYLDGTLVTVATYSGSIASPVGGFRDSSGNLADPTTVVLKYQVGNAPEVTATYPSSPIVKDAVGLYHANLDTTGLAPNSPVIESYRWIGTGAVQAPAQNAFEIRPPNPA